MDGEEFRRRKGGTESEVERGGERWREAERGREQVAQRKWRSLGAWQELSAYLNRYGKGSKMSKMLIIPDTLIL